MALKYNPDLPGLARNFICSYSLNNYENQVKVAHDVLPDVPYKRLKRGGKFE